MNLSNKRKRELVIHSKIGNICNCTFLFDEKLSLVDAFVYDLHVMFNLRDFTSV
jgi:hypothetical protein